ncbi:hypothetical protein BCR41DRAFT_390543 [Lobosporangium transversale]|uniref:Uncharacterized protein n=1 Tax=Lobosporangium transversale TaxID=64571 RepID=A0A1Y2G8F5_9FUNG|nr:hypothetical protein BCR41DRAFT_390543 [Lobosporangium transversale]ORY98392.1 hypothetical protein BCR41DRAFT_390543 [Lobosporangium transversale]|eukprot:XP_021875784.1 hypothetical protein BCR41DRAFT_390543 [Lobosporangium transversale]
MPATTPLSLYRRIDITTITREIVKGIPAGLVISLNAWAVSAWLKATILINSQPRWLFRKKRWSEGEMRAISCYYLVVAYLMLRVVRLTSSLTRRPGRPYGDFFRNTRPILGKVAIFSLVTMLLDEFIMFYILRKFGLEKRRILITGRPLDKNVQVSDDDCCICYGAMLDDDDLAEQADYSSGSAASQTGYLSEDTDYVLENFCVVKQHVAHRGCIRKWFNYGPKGYRPMDAFRIFSWGTTLHSAVAGMNAPRAVGGRMGLGWLLSTRAAAAATAAGETGVQLRVPLGPVSDTPEDDVTELIGANTPMDNGNNPIELEPTHRMEPASPTQQMGSSLQIQTQTQIQQPTLQPNEHTHTQIEVDSQQQQTEEAVDVAEPVLRPLFTQQDDYSLAQNAGHKTCPACRQQLVLNFVDLAKGRKEMGYKQKLIELGRDMTKFSDWRGLILRSLITAGWVGVTIIGGKLRIVAVDKAIMKHQRNRALATLSALAESS